MNFFKRQEVVPRSANQYVVPLVTWHLKAREARVEEYVEEGPTLADYFRELDWDPETVQARVFIDDQLIDQSLWDFTVPRSGQYVFVYIIQG